MRNPLKNEENAFRFVLGTIVYLALIVLASWLATWLGVVAFVVLTVAALGLLRGGAKPPPPTHHVDHAAVEDTRRILVVANETLEGARLHEEIVRLADGGRGGRARRLPRPQLAAPNLDVRRGRRPRCGRIAACLDASQPQGSRRQRPG